MHTQTPVHPKECIGKQESWIERALNMVTIRYTGSNVSTGHYPARILFIACVLLYSISAAAGHPYRSDSQYEWKLVGPGDADQVTSLTVLSNGTIFAGTDIGGLYSSGNRGLTWDPRNEGLQNLDITTPVIEDGKTGGLLYVGTRGGLYRSIDMGLTWENIREGLPGKSDYRIHSSIGSVAIDPFDHRRLLLGLGYRPSSDGTRFVRRLKWSKKIYHSIDRGASWSPVPVFDRPAKVYHIKYSGKMAGLVYLAASTGLYRSKNGGANWKRIFKKPVYNIYISNRRPAVILVSSGKHGVYRSDDLGDTWAEKNNGLSFFNFGSRFTNRYSVFAAATRKKSPLFVLNSTWGRPGGAYRSLDLGDSWEKVTENMPESWLKTSSRMNAITASNFTKGDIYLGSSRYLYGSDDNGENWKQLISERKGIGWTHKGINVFGHTRFLAASADDSKKLYIGTADHGLLRSRDSGESWIPLGKGAEGMRDIWDIGFCPEEPGSLFVVTSGRDRNTCFFHSADSGDSWYGTCEGLGKTGRDEKLQVDYSDCGTIYIATRKGVYRTADQGRSWKRLKGIPEKKVFSLVIDPWDHRKIYAGTGRGVMFSEDSGETWSLLKTFDAPVTAILASAEDPRLVLVGTSSYKGRKGGIYRSANGGKKWKKTLTEVVKYVSAFAQLEGDKNMIFASTMDHNYHDDSKGSGIYVSRDKGATWQRIDRGLPVSRAYNIKVSSNPVANVLVAAAGSGGYMAPLKQGVEQTVAGTGGSTVRMVQQHTGTTEK